MKRLQFYAIAISSLFSVSGFFFALKPSGMWQLAFGGFFLGLFLLGMVSGIFGIIKYSQLKVRSFIPAGICFLGILVSLVAIEFGGAARLWKFRRTIPQYLEIVRLIEKGEIKAGPVLSRIDLPERYAHLAYSSGAKTNSTGEVTVEFLIGGGFPVKHSGFLFVSAGNIENDPEMLQRWPKYSRINENWFQISD